MTELRKCPFCGGEAEIYVSDVTDRAIVYCTVCDAQISIDKMSKKQSKHGTSVLVRWQNDRTRNM